MTSVLQNHFEPMSDNDSQEEQADQSKPSSQARLAQDVSTGVIIYFYTSLTFQM